MSFVFSKIWNCIKIFRSKFLFAVEKFRWQIFQILFFEFYFPQILWDFRQYQYFENSNSVNPFNYLLCEAKNSLQDDSSRNVSGFIFEINKRENDVRNTWYITFQTLPQQFYLTDDNYVVL